MPKIRYENWKPSEASLGVIQQANTIIDGYWARQAVRRIIKKKDPV